MRAVCWIKSNAKYIYVLRIRKKYMYKKEEFALKIKIHDHECDFL